MPELTPMILHPQDPDWEKMFSQINSITQEEFPDIFPDGKVLGNEDDNFMWDTLCDALQDTQTTIAVLETDGKLVGYTFAVPAEKMYRDRDQALNKDSAYLYLTIVDPKLRGQKYGPKLTDFLIQELDRRGFQFVERDSKIENGYADKVVKHLGPSLVESRDYDPYGLGEQRYMRIQIKEYLKTRSPRT